LSQHVSEANPALRPRPQSPRFRHALLADARAARLNQPGRGDLGSVSSHL